MIIKNVNSVMKLFQDTVKEIRSTRSLYKIPPSQKMEANVIATSDIHFAIIHHFLKTLFFMCKLEKLNMKVIGDDWYFVFTEKNVKGNRKGD